MNSQKYLTIVNPHSGKKRGSSVLEQVQSALHPRGIDLDIRMTERVSHARQIAQESCLEGYTGICAIGGDGTFHEVVSGIMERKQKLSIPVDIIPGGTGNDVARHLGIKGVEDAIGHLLSGEVQPFDVAKVISGDQVDYCTTWSAGCRRRSESCRGKTPAPRTTSLRISRTYSSPAPNDGKPKSSSTITRLRTISYS